MKVFNALEEETFETPPVFNTAERKRYFTLPAGLDDLVETLRTPKTRSALFWRQDIFAHGASSSRNAFVRPMLISSRRGWTHQSTPLCLVTTTAPRPCVINR
jgi:hypothetical protein